jgi:type IV secretion system protein VirD4
VGQPAEPVLVLLDEFTQLGRLGPVETAVRVVAGYGVRLWLFVQDLPSLRDVYEEGAESFIANAGLFQAFGVSDKATAEYLSGMTGEATVRVTSESESSGVTYGRGGSSQEGTGASTSERGRRLMMPDEVRRMVEGEQLVFLRHRRPYRVGRLDYRVEAEMARRAAENPMYRRVSK